MSKEEIQYCFVNTAQQPLEVQRLGLFSYYKNYANEVKFTQLCKVFYPHPETPELKVYVLEFYEVEFPGGFDSTAMFTIDAMKGLQKVVKETNL